LTPPFADYGYQHQVLLPVVIRTPSALTNGATEKIAAHVHYLICREICIPGQKQLALELPVTARAAENSAERSNVQLFESARRQIPKPPPANWRISATSTGDEFRLRLKIGKMAGSPQFFPLEPEQIENAAPQNITAIPGGSELHLKKSNHLLKPIPRLKGVLVVAGIAYSIDIPVVRSGHGATRSMQN
jgi:DsbC/DsbD-like thiol-disulfide interchange protein